MYVKLHGQMVLHARSTDPLCMYTGIPTISFAAQTKIITCSARHFDLRVSAVTLLIAGIIARQV